MNTKIRYYVNDLFADAPDIQKTLELKEEIIANVTDKYNEMITKGVPEDDAFRAACASIGDIDDLIYNLKKNTQIVESTKDKKSRAIRTTIAVGLYIVSLIPVIMLDEFALNEGVGLCIFFLICAIATCILVYNSMTKPKYRRQDDTVVEEFKEWSYKKDGKSEAFGAISGALWTLVVVAYFVISFVTQAWAVSWLIFLIGACIQQIAYAIYKLTRK